MSGSKRAARRRFRFVLAHDARASTCDPLVEAVSTAFEDVDMVGASSVDAALMTLSRSRFDACLVCLDLPPAPVGGVRLAQAVLRGVGRASERHSVPVVLVTRSLRWLPTTAPELKRLPWVPPDASPPEVAKAIVDAMAQVGIPLPPISDVRLRDEAAAQTPIPRRRRQSFA